MTLTKTWAGFRSVLCPIDFSTHSQRALRYAAIVALRGKARLRVVSYNDPLLVAAVAAARLDRRLATRSARELQQFVRAAGGTSAGKRLHITSQVSVGNPSEEILKAAERYGSDLIVLGTHGLSGADRLLLGSTTLSVLQHTTVPVLAVPSFGVAGDVAVARHWPGPRIVAAIELDDRAAADVERAARVAAWFGASLLLAHVLTDIAAPSWLSADLTAHQRIRIARAQQQLEALAQLAQRHVTTDVRVVCGNIADELAALAAAERTSLLVTALHERRRWFGAARASIPYHVLTHAVTPVLAWPPQWHPR